jgi:hypothetical protein
LCEIDIEVHDIVASSLAEAKTILERRRADLDKGTKLPLSKETITADDFPPLNKSAPAAALPAGAGLEAQERRHDAAPHRTNSMSAQPRFGAVF